MLELSLFDDLFPRETIENNKKIVEKLSKRIPSSSYKGNNTIRDKMELIGREVESHLSFLYDKVEECRTLERFSKFVDNYITQEEGAIDSETLGLDYRKDPIFGFSLHASGEKSIYVPVLHKGFVTGQLLEEQLDKEIISAQLERINNSKTHNIFHNGKFDIHMFYHNFGVMLKCYWDTMIASRLLHSSEQDHSLKYQHNVKVRGGSGKPYDFKNLFEGVNPDMVPIKIMALYAAGDPFETLELKHYQEEEFKKYPGIYFVFKEIEMKVLPVVVKMEEDGVLIDTEILKQLTEKYTIKLEEQNNSCLEELNKYSDKLNRYKLSHPGVISNPINLSSPKQVAVILYDIIGLEQSSKYGRGTGKKVIDLLKDKDPFVKKLKQLRDAEKLVNGFIKSIPNFIKEDGRIHSDFVQVKGAGNTDDDDDESGADTGRFASKMPNLQQIPSKGEGVEIRKIFRASEGYMMFSADYSQQEIRVMANCSQDANMIKNYQQERDIYATVASEVYKMPYEDCLEFYPEGTKLIIDGKEIICGKKEHVNKEGKKRRGFCKSIVLGILYGRGQASIAEQTGMTFDEAKQLIDAFYKSFPTVKNWISQVESECRKNGYVDTIYGRRRELPDALLEDYEFKNKGGRPSGFNPLDFSNSKRDLDFTVDEETKKYYINKLNKAYGWKAKQEVIELAKSEGIEIKDNSQYISKAMRQAVNSIIQGSSADLSKRAMILCSESEELKQLGFRLLLPVHDELIAEAPEKNAKRCGELMAELMIKAASERCSVPMKCDLSFFKNWSGDEYSQDSEGNWFITDKH